MLHEMKFKSYFTRNLEDDHWYFLRMLILQRDKNDVAVFRKYRKCLDLDWGTCSLVWREHSGWQIS